MGDLVVDRVRVDMSSPLPLVILVVIIDSLRHSTQAVLSATDIKVRRQDSKYSYILDELGVAKHKKLIERVPQTDFTLYDMEVQLVNLIEAGLSFLSKVGREGL